MEGNFLNKFSLELQNPVTGTENIIWLFWPSNLPNLLQKRMFVFVQVQIFKKIVRKLRPLEHR